MRKTNLIIDDLVRNKVDPVQAKISTITSDCDIMADKINQLKEIVAKTSGHDELIANQGRILDKVAEGLGVEEVRRVEQFEKLQELVEKVKSDLSRTMDKRKNDTDTALREIRKDM